MKVEADKRSRDVEPAPEAERAARRAYATIARAETRAAKALATIERSRSYVLKGHSSVQAWAAKVGYGPQQTARLLELGRTLIAEPDLAEQVANGEVPAETAAQVGRVLNEPTLQLDPRQKADWKRKAAEEDPKRVRDEAEQAVEDARQGMPTFPLRFRVTKETRDGLRRVRLLMAKGQQMKPTDGEVLGRMVQDWLERHDPLRKPVPRRRGGTGKRKRDVPKKVQALVRRRSRDSCEICRVRRAREFVHIRPFADGGSNEVDNLAHGCRECHVWLDAGIVRFTHFDEAGRPVFRFARRPRGDGSSRVRERPREPVMATGPP